MKKQFSGPALQAGYAGSNPAGDAIDSRQLADPATRPKIGPSNGPSMSPGSEMLLFSAAVICTAAGCGAPMDPLPEAEACVTTPEAAVMMLVMGVVCGTAATLSERFKGRQERTAYRAEIRLLETKLQAYTDTRIEIQEDDRV